VSSDPAEALREDSLVDFASEFMAINPITLFFDCSTEDWEQKKIQYFKDLPRLFKVVTPLLGDKPYFSNQAHQPHYGEFLLWHLIDLILTHAEGVAALEEYPTLRQWYDRIRQHAGVSKYLSERSQAPNCCTPVSYLAKQAEGNIA
jgi:glutathione S-transferase